MPRPWIAGPKELLEHAVEHLQAGEPFDLRISFISIDNAVELTIKTYLRLPRREREGKGPSREHIEAATHSFPKLLDLLEIHAGDLLEGIEIGDIEWYHHTRNLLYHDGNGITVERAAVEAYLEIARILFEVLFGHEISLPTAPQTEIVQFIESWREAEHTARDLASKRAPGRKSRGLALPSALEILAEAGAVSPQIRDRARELAQARNGIVRSNAVPDSVGLQKIIEQLSSLVAELKRVASQAAI